MIRRLYKKFDEWSDRVVFINIDGYNNIQTNNYTLIIIALTVLLVILMIK